MCHLHISPSWLARATEQLVSVKSVRLHVFQKAGLKGLAGIFSFEFFRF